MGETFSSNTPLQTCQLLTGFWCLWLASTDRQQAQITGSRRTKSRHSAPAASALAAAASPHGAGAGSAGGSCQRRLHQPVAAV